MSEATQAPIFPKRKIQAHNTIPSLPKSLQFLWVESRKEETM